MVFRFSLGRSLMAVGVLTTMAVPVAGGVAYAASPLPNRQSVATRAPQHRSSTHHKTTRLTTRTAHVHIRSAAKLSKRSKILATLSAPGSTVMVRCYKAGASISGDTTWYRTVSPRAGFVAGHELNIAKEPATGVTACKTKK
jgi:hypothetical protein